MSLARRRARLRSVGAAAAIASASLVGLPSPPAAAAPTGQHVISIAEARARPMGTVVTVDGSVTTPSGVFESSFFDRGFGLQDRSAGIYVSLQQDLGVAPRRQARVTGRLATSFGLLILVPTGPADVKLHGAGPRVLPKLSATGEIGEATEGLLVRTDGTITQAPQNDLPYGFKLSIDDGTGELVVFVNVQTGIDLSGLTVGQRVSVTGFSGHFDDHYEVLPRSPADLVVLDS
jgi:hypothetical protein